MLLKVLRETMGFWLSALILLGVMGYGLSKQTDNVYVVESVR
jgi:hypothetical protein